MATATPPKPVSDLVDATVRFCGDSGDGMQLAGTQFTNTSALLGNDVATFPDFPAEIRAPRGTKAGVIGFPDSFSSTQIFTPGDTVDALVAMNPAALTTNIADLRDGGILLVNKDAFDKKGLEQAGYATDPLEDGSLSKYKLHAVDMTRLTRLAVEGLGLSQKESDRCRNFFAMGLVFWLYDRSLDPTLRFIETKFGKLPGVAQANTNALKAGYNYGETVEAINTQYHVGPAKLSPGTYRNIEGQRSAGLGIARCGTTVQQATVFGCLSDYSRQRHSALPVDVQELRRAHFPGRRRNRRRSPRPSVRRLLARWPSRPPAVLASHSRPKRWAWP